MPRLDDIVFDNVTVSLWHVTESLQELTMLCTREGITLGELPCSVARCSEMSVERLLLNATVGVRRLEHDADGAPVVPDLDARVSISHTRGLVALAVSRQARHGVDVEYRSDRVARVVERFMNDDEQQRFVTIDEQLLAWTAKEAMFKAEGNSKLLMTAFQVDRLPDGITCGVGHSATTVYDIMTRTVKDCILTLTIARDE